MTKSFYLLLSRCLPSIPVWITIVCSVILSCENGVLWNSSWFSFQFSHTSVFPQSCYYTLSFSRCALCELPISSHKILRHTQGPRFNNICIHIHFNLLWMHSVKVTMPTSTWCFCVLSFWGAGSFTHDCFCSFGSNINSKKES